MSDFRTLKVCFAVALLSLVALVFAPGQTDTSPTHCEICGNVFIDVIYTGNDKVTGKNKLFCSRCIKSDKRCFACSLPVVKDGLTLEDGRAYCARDAKAALIDTNAVLTVTDEVDQVVRRLFQDRMTFPDESLINRKVIDRLHLTAWYKLPGNDHECPNVLGIHQLMMTPSGVSHDIHVLSGLTMGETRTTYAHELTHAWVAANIPRGRNLSRDAHEGFCELIAYLLAEHLNDAKAQQVISSNTYTRGQFGLLLKAHQAHTLPAIIDWLRFGTEPAIDAADIDLVRRAGPPARPAPQKFMRYVEPTVAAELAAAAYPDKFELKVVTGTAQRRTALINGRVFLAGEAGKVRKGTNLVEIKCVEVGADFARIEIPATGGQELLQLVPPKVR